MESQHTKAIIAITLTAFILLATQGQALLHYWQQTHHQLMHISQVPQIPSFADHSDIWERWASTWDEFQTQSHYRMVLAGQILLAGSEALPKPVIPPVPECPALPEVKIPECVAKQELPQLPNVNVIAETDVINKVESTEIAVVQEPVQSENAMPVGESSLSIEPTADAIAKAKEPIGLQAGDKVLLIGDSLMQGLAPHINVQLKKRYQVVSMDLSRHSTGLTYPSFFDWPATVKAAFELEHYTCVIVFLGANDPWDIPSKGRYIRFGSDEWKAIYRERVANIISTVASHNARLIWLGAPPMGRDDLVKKIPVLNEIYQQELDREPLSARYIATGPIITENGTDFIKFMTIPEKGSVNIRADDGVHFTTQGQKLLANFMLLQFAAPQLEGKVSAL
jgi:hypothetical protein